MLPVQPHTAAFRRQAMRISIPTYAAYEQSVHRVFGPYFVKLDERIETRWGHFRWFLDNAQAETTRARKAMWKNLSKGQRWHAQRLQRTRVFCFALIPVSYIAFAALFVFAVGAVVNWAI